MSKESPERYLRRFSGADSYRLFAIGPQSPLVTFSAQQTRAVNLIWALSESGLLSESSRVGILGGGLAGITAAVGARRYGAKVSLFEPASEICHIVRNNVSRLVHPNIHVWPEDGFDVDRTSFPYLNWSSGNPKDIISQIEEQWSEYASGVNCHFGYEVSNVLEQEDGISVLANRSATASGPNPIQSEFDLVIVTVGFGRERFLDGQRGESYWNNDSLADNIFVGRDDERVLISGNGDGAIADVLRVLYKDVSHVTLATDVYGGFEHIALLDCLKSIERGIPLGTALQRSIYLKDAYGELEIPESSSEFLRNRRISNRKVVINGRGGVLLNSRATLLNRFVLFHTMDLGFIEQWVDGTIVDLTGDNVTVKTNSAPIQIECDKVVIRHGPEDNFASLMESGRIETISSLGENTDATLIPQWGLPAPKSALVNLEHYLESSGDFEPKVAALWGKNSLAEIVSQTPEAQELAQKLLEELQRN